MSKKIIVFLGILVVLTIMALVILSVYTHKQGNNSKILCDKLKSLEQKEQRLSNMEKTLKVVYNISNFEAHYYSIIFDDFSQKANVPWEAYPALIRIESNFNPTVMSPARCKGITQVAEGTAKEMAGKLGIPYSETTLWNEILNLVIGLSYFNEGFSEVKSLNPDSALQHAMRRYCGGPGYSKINATSRVYVGEYKATVWEEYTRLSYIYKGVIYDGILKSTPQQTYPVASVLQPVKKFWGDLMALRKTPNKYVLGSL